MAEFLDGDYAATRRALISLERAWSSLPPPGRLGSRIGWEKAYTGTGDVPRARADAGDTTYRAVMDRRGMIFSSTPSGGGDFVPSLGIPVSHRGRHSWFE
jgi:gamma-glutamyltranspeptidase